MLIETISIQNFDAVKKCSVNMVKHMSSVLNEKGQSLETKESVSIRILKD